MSVNNYLENCNDRPSLHLCRTNPKLTTNVKLVTNGNDIWLDSFSAVVDLSDDRYKAYKVSPLGYYNKQVSEFYKGIDADVAYNIAQEFNDTVVNGRYDQQYETTYWAGCERINSLEYNETLGILAPLWIGDKLPGKFCVFRVKDPSYRVVSEEGEFDIQKDVLDKCELVKTFDLSEESVFGAYIHRYVSQYDFPQSPLYVNFNDGESNIYYGFSLKDGVFLNVPEYAHERMFETDDTIGNFDNYITDGWKRNHIAIANMLNIQFLFDDDGVEDYSFNRYFGLYCDFVDASKARLDMANMFINGRLYDVYIPDNVMMKDNRGITLKVLSDDDDELPTNVRGGLLAVEDKFGQLHSVEEIDGNEIKLRDEEINISSLCGVAPCDIELKGETKDGPLYSYTMLHTYDIKEKSNIVLTFYNTQQDGTNKILGVVSSDDKEGVGHFVEVGTASEIAKRITKTINDLEIDELSATIGGKNKDFVIVKAKRVVTTLYGHFGVNMECGGAANIGTYPQNDSDDVEFSCGTLNTYWTTDSLDTTSNGLFLYDKNNYYAKSNDDKGYTKLIKKDSIPSYDDADCMNLIFERMLSTKYNTLNLYEEYKMSVGRLAFVPICDFDVSFVENPSTYGLDEESGELDLFKYDTTTMTYERVGNEYDVYGENYNKGSMMLSRTVPYIMKWGIDKGSDVKCRPYRLNISSVFGFNNFAPNPYGETFDASDMYNGEWQYILNNGETNGRYIHCEYATQKDLVSALLSQDDDVFDELFYDRRSSKNPCKYSTLRHGTAEKMAKTFFRGALVHVCDKDDYKELPNNECAKRYGNMLNGYRFAVATIVGDVERLEDMVMVRNDKWGTICIVLSFPYQLSYEVLPQRRTKDEVEYQTAYDMENCPYTTENIYNGFEGVSVSNGKFPLPTNTKGASVDTMSKFAIVKDTDVSGMLSIGDEILLTTLVLYNDDEYSVKGFVARVDGVSGNKIKYTTINGYSDTIVSCNADIDEANESLFANADQSTTSVYLLADNARMKALVNKYNDNGRYGNIFSIINGMSETSMRVMHIDINGHLYDTNKGEYTTYIDIREPEYNAKYEYLVCESGVDFDEYYIKNLGSSMLNRYSYFYEPIKRVVLGTCAEEGCSMNTSFDLEREGSAIIPLLGMHKVNERDTNVFRLSLNEKAIYPKSGKFAIGYKDEFNVFRPRWADKYYVRTLSAESSEDVYGTASMTERKSMFGSVCMHAPQNISVSDFTPYENGISSYVENKNVFGNRVSFDLLLSNLLRDTLFEQMQGVFDQYINKSDGFGNPDTTDDDVVEYINQNLLDIYKISKLQVWVDDVRNVSFSNNVNFVDTKKSGMGDGRFSLQRNVGMKHINANDLDVSCSINVQRNFLHNITIDVEYELR